MTKAAHFATRQTAADNAVSYSQHMGWGCTGRRVRTAHIPNGPYLAMAKHDDEKWRHIDWYSDHLAGMCLNYERLSLAAHLILAFAFGYTTVGALDSLARQLGVFDRLNSELRDQLQASLAEAV